MQDKQYAAFQSKLTPGVPPESFIGIRVPELRKFAKEFAKEVEVNDFVHQLPHKYYDENMLHSLLISQVKDYEECIRLTDAFLPHVDNCGENFINPTENNVTPNRTPSFIFAKKTNDDKEIFQSNRDGMCRLRSTYQYSPQ